MVHMEATNTANMKKCCGKLTRDENSKAIITIIVSKVVKPTWMKEITFETYRNQVTASDAVNLEVI